MAQCVPALVDHHRRSLDTRILTVRRLAFLSAALNQLDT